MMVTPGTGIEMGRVVHEGHSPRFDPFPNFPAAVPIPAAGTRFPRPRREPQPNLFATLPASCGRDRPFAVSRDWRGEPGTSRSASLPPPPSNGGAFGSRMRAPASLHGPNRPVGGAGASCSGGGALVPGVVDAGGTGVAMGGAGTFPAPRSSGA